MLSSSSARVLNHTAEANHPASKTSRNPSENRQPTSSDNVSRERKAAGDFIPYINERDGLGNLLTRQKSADTLSRKGVDSVKTSRKPKMAQTGTNFLQLSPTHSHSRSQDFDFANFKFQARTSGSVVRLQSKTAVKPLDLKFLSTPTLSPCFLTPGRKEERLAQSPSVGQYTISHRMLYRNVQKVSFTKDSKIKPPTVCEYKDEAEVDLVKSFNKVYQKNTLILDFNRHTNRESHYYSRINTALSPAERGGGIFKIDYQDILNKNPITMRENHESEPLWRKGFELNNKNLPLNMGGLHEKFGQVK